MDKENEYVLRKFYNELYNSIVLSNKLKKESIIISMFKTPSNKRYDLLSSSSLISFKFKKSIINDLISNELIRSIDSANEYSITAKGVWQIEIIDKKISYDDVIEYIDKEYFNLFESNKSLTEKEKIILFSMICSRTFSEDSCADLRKSAEVSVSWKNIFDICGEKLVNLGIIKEYPANIYGKGGNEDPVSYLLKRANHLFKKTRGIYMSPGEQKYYLKLSDKNHLKENLSFLLWLIFGNKLEVDDIELISEFCNNIAYDMGIYVFDLDEYHFSNPEYDDILNEAFMDVVFSNNKW
ncbi:hypothetical protein [Methanococcoides methylutens]|uniref:Uncharacterized protein n=1 Tax=Methanococcoides methylutens MM1 TaxID=1434104 RepID=A0A0E3X1A4_METMT|nr:hypothetical protein [Methanococcoides methylutens]AKB85990.1 hypothetical protein MCMEM_1937 [Methanococcoides methylutens MM1]